MLYDKYQDKIMGVIRTIGKIRRFRVLIISVLVAVLALTAGFLVTKGTVLEDPHPEALSYGEALPQSAKALFSSVRYEYRAAGSSEWSEQAPSKVGSYTVRAVSKGSFGRVTYGKEYAFVISPQAITVHAAEEAVQYGTLPTLKAEGLCYADTAVCEQFSIADTTKRSTEVTPVASSVVILNRFGEDVTDCYTITVATTALTLNPRPITLTVASKEIEYNGQPLTADIYELTAGELVTGDRLSTEFGCSQTDVGETVNEMTVCITNRQGIDVTGQYQIEQVRGLLKVVPRIVVLSTGSAEYVYDGESHQNTTFVIDLSTPLLEGHEVTASDPTTIVDVGEIPNRLTLDICDAAGTSVKELYYEVRVSVGTLTVTPRPISVTTNTQSWVYDGEYHMSDAFTVTEGSVVEGETAALENNALIQDVGEVANEGSLCIMAGDKDVTANYAVEISFGTLTVEQRPIQLTSPNATFVYNSEPQSCEEALQVTEGSLVENHQLDPVYVALTDAGETPNSFTVTVRDALGEDISFNYSITTVFGTLTVEKRPVTFLTGSATRIYDGTALYCDDLTVTSEYKIADGEDYRVVTHTEIVNVGRVVNELTVSIWEENEDRTANYAITYDTESAGYLEVLPRPFKIYSNSVTKVYNGLPLTCHEYTLATEDEGSYGLAPDQQLADVVFTGSILDVTEGGVENAFTFTIRDLAGEETISNYDVMVVFGRLTLLPRPVTFTSGSTEKIYDDTPLSYHEYTASEVGEDMGVVSFHTVAMTFTADIVDVGEIENAFTAVIRDENGREVTQNYEITYVNGTLKVTPRPIIIVTGTDEKVYDGTPLYCENLTWEPATGLLGHHTVSVIKRTEQTNVAENVENRLVVRILHGEADKTANYEITYRYGTLTVTKRPITVVTGTAERVYDDTPLYCEDVTGKPSDALVNGHAFAVIEHTEQTDVATVENKLVVRIFEGDVDQTANYAITYEYGTLTVTKRPITVVTNTVSKVYDDTPLYDDNVYCNPADALLEGHDYDTVARTEQTDVAENVENRVIVRIVKNGVDKTANYEITYEYGTLTVTKRPITLVTGSADRVYDDTPFYWEEVSCDPADALVNGHSYDVIEHTERTDAGSVENKLVVRILKDGVDKSANYEISYRYGTLTVNPRPITVVTGSAEQVYNGEPLFNETVSVSTTDGLVNAHILRVTGTWPTITDAGSIENAVTVSIFKGDADKTANYEITYEYGTLTVKPRPITVVTGSADKVYDDTPLAKEEVSVRAPTGENDGLLPQHTVVAATTFPNRTDVGTTVNAVEITVLEGDRDVSGNYEVTYEYGTLTVTKRSITVVTGSAERMYDDTPLYCEDVTCKPFDALVSGHSYVVSARTEQTDVATDVVNKLVVRIVKGDVDKTENYEITYEYGTLTVTKRPITVVTSTSSRVYDDTPFYDDTVTCDPADALLDGHSYVVVDHTEQIDVAENVENRVVVRIVKGDVDKTQNYEISYRYGTLTVTKRPITLVTGSADRVYDDTPFYWEEVSCDPADALVSGHDYDVIEHTEQTDAGAVENKLVVRIVKGDVDKSANYEISYRYGTLTVTPRPITVVTGSAEQVYNGNPFSFDAVSISTPNGLVSEHSLRVMSVWPTITDAGSIENAVTVCIFKGDVDKTTNYDITYEYGTLTVTPRPITVVTGGAEQMYNDEPLAKEELRVLEPTGENDGLLGYHTVVMLNPFPSITDVGTVSNAVEIAVMEGDRDVSSNYAITYQYGDLVVTPRPITVVTGSAERVYDDTPLYHDVPELKGEYGLAADHRYEVTAHTEQTDVATDVVNKLVIRILKGDADKTANYAITYEYGTLTVTPRPITVVTGSAERIYDDTPLYHDVPELKGAYGLAADHRYEVTEHTEQTDVATDVVNKLVLRIYKGDADKTANYAITYEYGTLTVTPRPLTVVTGSAERAYNGLPLFVEPTANGLVEGHTLSILTRTQLTNAGSVQNVATVCVLKGDADKTANYAITYEYGTLTVTPRVIVVTAAGAEKPYDGTPLTAPKAIAVPNADLDALNEEVGPDHRFTWSVLAAEGSQTEVGTSPSHIEPEQIQFYFDNTPVEAGNLVVTVLDGALTVTEPKEDGGNNGGGGLDQDGDIDGGDNNDSGSGDEEEKEPSARVFTTKSTVIYLRGWSYGNYNGRSWSTDPTVYGPLLNNTHSMNYLTGEALAAAGFTRIEMRIESNFGDYLLPYYLTIDGHEYEVQTNDVRNSGDTSKEYAVYYYAYDYLSNPTLIGAVPATYAEAEAAYSAFVHQQYLQIPAGTLSFMQGIIAEQGFDANDPQIIAKVASYIRSAAVYDLDYDRTLDDAEDVVIAFLSQYKTGICQHYASAATLLYRALGIPARYTVGYLTETVAGEWVDVTGDTAHAWVEVYLDGIGWVQIEVTGSSQQPPDGGEEDEEEDLTKTAIEIYLFEIQKYYDGKPLSYDPDDWYCITALPAGYTVLLELSGSLTDVGSLSLEELQKAHAHKLTVLDAEGNDVSDQYRLVLKGKPLTVKERLLEITAGSAVKVYDGEKLTCTTYVISQGTLAAGHRIVESSLRFEGGQTDAGESTNAIKEGSVRIVDANGNDVTDNYAISLEEGTLTVLEA